MADGEVKKSGRGGKRTPKDGKKIGRPKQERVVDGNVARKIKARVKAEELWVFLIAKAAEKARNTGNTADLRNALAYLDDRDLGRCVQIEEVDASINGSLNLDPSARLERLSGLLARALKNGARTAK